MLIWRASQGFFFLIGCRCRSTRRPGSYSSSKQFDDFRIVIFRNRRCRWRAAPGSAALLQRARRFGGKLGAAHTKRYRLALADEEQPVSAETSGRDSASAQGIPNGSGKRCTTLARGPQSYQHSCPPVRAKTRVQRTIPLCPHLQNLDFVIVQFKFGSESFGSCGGGGHGVGFRLTPGMNSSTVRRCLSTVEHADASSRYVNIGVSTRRSRQSDPAIAISNSVRRRALLTICAPAPVALVLSCCASHYTTNILR